MVADSLRAAHGWGPEWIEIVAMTTTGDQIQDRPLSEVGGKGLWTKELDRALQEGRTDLSVHSMKDVETIRPVELVIAAMLPRADVRDRLVGAESIEALPHWGRVGTSSPRRTAQLLSRRPDLNIVAFRGNVATRLRRLKTGEADATLLAAAGLDRLGHPEIGVTLNDLLPAPAQGAIGVEVLAGHHRARDAVSVINHAPTCACVAAERALLKALGGDCRSPIAALATFDGDTIVLRAEILSNDGKLVERGQIEFREDDADAPARFARELLDRASPPLRALFAG
jgi:hydroxymethylbilane synthase